MGLGCAKNTVCDYLAYLEDAFLVFHVAIHSSSEKRKQVNPRKCYCVDSGLVCACLPPDRLDSGHLLENLVFIELLRRRYQLWYHVTRAGREVDFFGIRPDGATVLIQVCADMSDAATRQRELAALDQAMDETGLREGTVITLYAAEEVALAAGRVVRVMPAWRWLLEAGA